MSYDYIPVRSSRITLTELMVPSYGNFGGKVHGGHILSMMDKVAYTCASTHSRGYCVTVSVEGVDFLAPIEVGELVSMHASINYVGKSSMVVGIKVVAENFKKGIVKHTNTSYFTMVAMDEESKKPRKVPGLLLESDIDIRRFLEAMKSATLKREYRAEIREAKAELNIDLELGLLEGQNCKIPEVSDIYDRPDRND